MEAVLTPNKQIRIKTPKKNGRGNFIPNPSENFDTYAGLLKLNPPPRAMSLSSPLPASFFNHHQYRQNQHQPPLLPLPNVSALNHHHHTPLSRSFSSQGLSLPPPRKNRTKDMALTPKKSTPTKREEAKNKRTTATQSISEFLVVASDNRWGPDPKDLPKHLPVLTSKVLPGKVSVENMDMFSGSVLSPPPSSLPLPKFSLRSKLSCNAEAASVDVGATNNLRRLLRLR